MQKTYAISDVSSNQIYSIEAPVPTLPIVRELTLEELAPYQRERAMIRQIQEKKILGI
jgi:hypothetical protein